MPNQVSRVFKYAIATWRQSWRRDKVHNHTHYSGVCIRANVDRPGSWNFLKGVQTSENKIDKQKEKKDKRGEGGRFSIYSALIRVNSYLAIETAFKTIFFFYKYNLPDVFFPQKQILHRCGSIVKCVSDVTVVWGRESGVLPPKNVGSYGVKSCNFRQNKHGNALS